MAEEEGFEPSKGFHPCRFSRPVHSTALPPLHKKMFNNSLVRGKVKIRQYLAGPLISKISKVKVDPKVDPKWRSNMVH